MTVATVWSIWCVCVCHVAAMCADVCVCVCVIECCSYVYVCVWSNVAAMCADVCVCVCVIECCSYVYVCVWSNVAAKVRYYNYFHSIFNSKVANWLVSVFSCVCVCVSDCAWLCMYVCVCVSMFVISGWRAPSSNGQFLIAIKRACVCYIHHSYSPWLLC